MNPLWGGGGASVAFPPSNLPNDGRPKKTRCLAPVRIIKWLNSSGGAWVRCELAASAWASEVMIPGTRRSTLNPPTSTVQNEAHPPIAMAEDAPEIPRQMKQQERCQLLV